MKEKVLGCSSAQSFTSRGHNIRVKYPQWKILPWNQWVLVKYITPQKNDQEKKFLNV